MAEAEAARRAGTDEKDRPHENAADQFSGARKSAPATQQADSLPSVSLPKSGGAIRGLGEKFSVNAATGTSILSIPFPLSPRSSAVLAERTVTTLKSAEYNSLSPEWHFPASELHEEYQLAMAGQHLRVIFDRVQTMDSRGGLLRDHRPTRP